MWKVLCIGTALLVGSIAQSWSQSYPDRPVTIVVPYGPGASTDNLARMIADELSSALGQPFVVDNRPGAGGTLGSASVANAEPDGYTLLVTVNNPIVHNVYLQKDFPFDPATAFMPVSLLADVVLMLAVHPSLPVTTVGEFVSYAKANPTALAYGSAGVGTSHHIAGELFKKFAGIDMNHIPYGGGSAVVVDLVAGHIPVGFGTTPTIVPQAEAGALRILGITEAQRSADYPDVPAISETVPGVVVSTWTGLYAPAGTPPAVIDRLNQVVVKALKKPENVAKLKKQGLLPSSSTSAELGERVSSELATWGKLFKELGFQPQ